MLIEAGVILDNEFGRDEYYRDLIRKARSLSFSTWPILVMYVFLLNRGRCRLLGEALMKTHLNG